MKRLAVCLLLLAPALCRAGDDPEPRDKGGDLMGEWVVEKVIGKGPGPPPPGLVLVLQKGKMTVKEGNQVTKEHAFTTDAKKKPAHFDLTDSNNGKKVEGIYKIEKGELYLCIGERTGKRPTAFDGKDEAVIVLKRQKKK